MTKVRKYKKDGSMTAGQRRYQDYLYADSGLSFMEWIKYQKELTKL